MVGFHIWAAFLVMKRLQNVVIPKPVFWRIVALSRLHKECRLSKVFDLPNYLQVPWGIFGEARIFLSTDKGARSTRLNALFCVEIFTYV